VDDAIPLMADGKILPYLDVPFQHGSPAVLKRMRRPAAQEKTMTRISRWREICPDLTIRSTFIVGFPGETEEEFGELLTFLEEAQLDRVGCFKYEPVRGAVANDAGDPVPQELMDERYKRFMELQQKISTRRLKRKVGRREKVIIDSVTNGIARGRTRGDAPEIDGLVHLTMRRPVRVGEIVTGLIERSDEYDLHGQVVGF
jgi:ribosomal protein S12 methylthiotransferase